MNTFEKTMLALGLILCGFWLLMASGCGYETRYPPKVSEKYGVTVSAPSHLPLEQAEEMIAIAHRLWMQETGVPPESLEGYLIEVLETREECGEIAGPVTLGKPGKTKIKTWMTCEGVNVFHKKYIGVVDRNCWADMSLVHELLHWWLAHYRPDIDPRDHHYEEEFFAATNSIELRARAIGLFDGVCGFIEKSPTAKSVPNPPGHVSPPG